MNVPVAIISLPDRRNRVNWLWRTAQGVRFNPGGTGHRVGTRVLGRYAYTSEVANALIKV